MYNKYAFKIDYLKIIFLIFRTFLLNYNWKTLANSASNNSSWKWTKQPELDMEPESEICDNIQSQPAQSVPMIHNPTCIYQSLRNTFIRFIFWVWVAFINLLLEFSVLKNGCKKSFEKLPCVVYEIVVVSSPVFFHFLIHLVKVIKNWHQRNGFIKN